MEGKMGLFLLATLRLVGIFLQAPGANANVPAIFVFGDSTVDVGNNNYLPGNLAKADFPPNGIDYPQHKPTGRFSNGYIGVDFLAKKLGFKKSPPPYLSITSDAQLFQGVNFASGGSGNLDATGQNYSIPLNAQIKFFEGVLHRLKTRMGDIAADLFLSKSLFIFGTGTNDLFAFYLISGLENQTQVEQFLGLLTSQYRNQLQTLYKLGARKFGVFGSGGFGCVPILRANTPSGNCVEELNELSQQFNNATQLQLHDLASTSPGLLYAFVNNNEIFSTITSNPLKHGLKEIEAACCGSGRFNAESACTPNATYCSNRREYFFWDSSHPTQAAYNLMTDRAYHGGQKFATPINLEELAKS